MNGLLQDLRLVLMLFLSERRRPLLTGMLLAAATVLTGIALLGLSGWFITATAIAGLSTATALAFDVFAPSAGIRFLALARTASRYGERVTTHDATLGVLAILRERLFRTWAEPGAAKALMMRPARLLFRLTADIDALDSLYLRVLVPAGTAVCAALATAVALGFMHPLLGLGVGAGLLLTGLGIPFVAARLARSPARRRAHALEALRSRTIDLIAGQTDLVMAGRLEAQCEAVAAADRRLAEADDDLNRIETSVAAVFSAITAFLLACTLLAVANLAESGRFDAPVAALGLLIAFASVEPFAALRRGALEFGRTLLAARHIGGRIATVAESPTALHPPQGLALRLTAVTARYNGAAGPALHHLSLSLAKGERIAVIGPSGAGKSTLLALAAGETFPETGVVERLPATLLTQRTELFQDSLRDNLLLADPEADDLRLREVLQAAGLLDDVAGVPGCLDARLGEGGLGLSGGQARRLALARLFLRNTPLWLLDEPTEGLDGETARDVLRRLAARAGGRAIVIATHVRREAEIADRLLIMNHGCVVAAPRRGEPAFDAALGALRPD